MLIKKSFTPVESITLHCTRFSLLCSNFAQSLHCRLFGKAMYLHVLQTFRVSSLTQLHCQQHESFQFQIHPLILFSSAGSCGSVTEKCEYSRNFSLSRGEDCHEDGGAHSFSAHKSAFRSTRAWGLIERQRVLQIRGPEQHSVYSSLRSAAFYRLRLWLAAEYSCISHTFEQCHSMYCSLSCSRKQRLRDPHCLMTWNACLRLYLLRILLILKEALTFT